MRSDFACQLCNYNSVACVAGGIIGTKAKFWRWCSMTSGNSPCSFAAFSHSEQFCQLCRLAVFSTVVLGQLFLKEFQSLVSDHPQVRKGDHLKEMVAICHR